MLALEGIRVLDLTHVFAGPFAAMQLGMLGAEVIKIEAPTRPDMMRADGSDAAMNAAGYGVAFQAQNAAKKSLTVDLARDEGQAVFRRLLATADVVIQNYTGPAMRKLKLMPEDVHAVNSRIVYCSICGYGRTGPKADHPAYDIVIQAHSGLMSVNGHKGGDPVRVGPAMVDYGTGAQAAFAIAAALFARERSGEGAVLDVAMADAALLLMASDVAETRATGHAPRPRGNRHAERAGYGLFAARDRDMMIGAYTAKQNADLMMAIGHPDAAAALRGADRATLIARHAEDTARIEAAIATRDAAEWEDLLNAAHVPAAAVRDVAEALDHPQYASRGVSAAVRPTVDGGLPVTLTTACSTGARQADAPPVLGAHTDALLSALGYTASDIAALRSAGVI